MPQKRNSINKLFYAGDGISTRMFVLSLIAVYLIGAVSGAVFLGIFGVANSNNAALEKPVFKESAAEITIVAITSNGEGLASKAVVEIKEGKGRVLVATNPFIEPDTQMSAETAAKVAQEITKKSLDEKDVLYSFDVNKANLVGGPSAGAALAVATIAAIEQRKVKEDVAITGTIEEDGRIGEIGGIIEKAAGVAQAGKKVFLVPSSQLMLGYYEPHVQREQRGNLIIERTQYVKKILDLRKYAKEEFGIEVIGVATIEEALGYALE